MSDKNISIDKLISCMGGSDNITSVLNCMTRLRLTVRDEGLTDEPGLGAIDGVMGVVHDRKNTYEIVVGPGKSRRYADMLRAMHIGQTVSDTDKKPVPESRLGGRIKPMLKVIGDIFIPMIPGVITAGLCASFASMIKQFYPGYADGGFISVLYYLLSLVSTSFMAYLTAWAGYRAAERFGATPIIGGMIGMITTLDGVNEIARILGLYNDAEPLSSTLMAGKGGVLAVIVGVYLYSLLEKNIRKIVPAGVDIILTSFLSLVIFIVPYILVLMPLFGYISSAIVYIVGLFCSSDNILVRIAVGYVSAALFLPMVATGMHHGLVALYAIQLDEIGYVTLYPALATAGAGQVGAAIAIGLRAKRLGNKKLTQAVAGGLPAGILGVGEPLIYGVTLPLGKPFITAGIGAGFGGAFVMAMQVAATAWGPSGVLGVFMMTGGPNSVLKSTLVYLLSLVIACVGGALVTHFTLKDKDVMPDDADGCGEEASSGDMYAERGNVSKEVKHDESIFIEAGDGRIEIKAPADGRVVGMRDIPDPVFSDGTLGPCIGIEPVDGMIYAPCDGIVTGVVETLHAVTIRDEWENEFLIHIGLDTVELKGKGFMLRVSEGESVRAGECIMQTDPGLIRQCGYSAMVIVALPDRA